MQVDAVEAEGADFLAEMAVGGHVGAAVAVHAKEEDRVDVAQLGRVLGRADVRRATAREANELTGFVIGGIPPFGHPRRLRVVMDPGLGRFETVWAAAGLPTVVFPVAPGTLRMLADATVAPVAEERPPAVPPAAA